MARMPSEETKKATSIMTRWLPIGATARLVWHHLWDNAGYACLILSAWIAIELVMPLWWIQAAGVSNLIMLPLMFVFAAGCLLFADFVEKVRGIQESPRSLEASSNHSAFLEFRFPKCGFEECNSIETPLQVFVLTFSTQSAIT